MSTHWHQLQSLVSLARSTTAQAWRQCLNRVLVLFVLVLFCPYAQICQVEAWPLPCFVLVQWIQWVGIELFHGLWLGCFDKSITHSQFFWPMTINKQWHWTMVWASLPVQLSNTSVQLVWRESVKQLGSTPLNSFKQGKSRQHPWIEIRTVKKLWIQPEDAHAYTIVQGKLFMSNTYSLNRHHQSDFALRWAVVWAILMFH